MPAIQLLPKQRQFIKLPPLTPELCDENGEPFMDVSAFIGGFGSGKTFTGSLLGTILMLKYPGCIGLVGAQTYTLVRDTTLQSYFQHLELFGMEKGKHYDYNQGESVLSFANGSKALFRHFDDVNSLKSLNVHWVEVEEMSDIPFDTFKILLSRPRLTVKKDWDKTFRYRLFGHSNPEFRANWMYRMFVTNKAPNYRVVNASTTENKFLPAGYAERLACVDDEDYYKVFILGNFGSGGSNVMAIPELKIKQLGKKYNTDMDITISGYDVSGGGDNNVRVVIKGNPINGWNLIDKEKWNNVDTVYTTNKIISELYKYDVCAIDATGVGLGIAEQVRDSSGSFVNSPFVHLFKAAESPSVANSQYLNKRAEAFGMVKDLINQNKLNGDDIGINEDLRSIFFEIKNNGKIQMQSKKDIKKLIGRSPDEGDALSIAVDATRFYNMIVQKKQDALTKVVNPYVSNEDWRVRYNMR